MCCSDFGGMLKLWNVKTSECLKSLEVSDDDATVWALAVDTKEDHVITGASNSTLILWKVVSHHMPVHIHYHRTVSFY